jgi:hypothetical protein
VFALLQLQSHIFVAGAHLHVHISQAHRAVARATVVAELLTSGGNSSMSAQCENSVCIAIGTSFWTPGGKSGTKCLM